MADDQLKQFKDAGQKLLDVGDRKLVLAMRKEIRVASKPVGERILGAIADGMPKAGGLAEKIRSQGRVSMLVDLKRGVRIQLANKAGMYMEAFEKGMIRHKLFGNSRSWYQQRVPSGLGKAQFDAETPAIAEQVTRTVTETMRRAL